MTAPTATDRARLAALPLFAALDPADRAELFAGIRIIDAQGRLFGQGDPADAFYAVLAGVVRLVRLSASGGETVIMEVGPGETFAEAAVFGRGRYPVAAEARAGTRLARVDGAATARWLSDHAEVLPALLAALWHRETQLAAEIATMKARAPDRRLAGHLLAHLERGDWAPATPWPGARNLLAARIGVTPEALSRIVRRLVAEGVLDNGGLATDATRLRAFLAPGPDEKGGPDPV